MHVCFSPVLLAVRLPGEFVMEEKTASIGSISTAPAHAGPDEQPG
jgi:hypothetical protein